MTSFRPRTSSRLKLPRVAAPLLAALLLFSNTGALAAGQQTFASPEQAADALAAASRDGDKAALLKIFGPAGIKLVSSGDGVADKIARTKLAVAYAAQHRIENGDAHKAQLILGNDDFPYPIPLVQDAGGWRFDTRAGAEEILNRRIGRNELGAIEACRAYVEAQRDYASRDRTGGRAYAMKIVSRNGNHDGLYWPAKAGEEESPLGPLVAAASAEGYSVDARAPYHGYYYRILTRQGANAPGGAFDYVVDGRMSKGYALVAFPAKYGNSGVMTFIVNQDGIVFQKNLGPHTAQIARAMAEYDPDQTWITP